MSHTTSRRDFLKSSTLAGVGLLVGSGAARAQGQSPNEKLNIAVIGVGGRGGANLGAVKGENIVALCDIDEVTLAKAAAAFPQAATYHDFRKMLERKDIDAVVVSTPDHTHAPATLIALDTGRHVYTEKPLTHSVYEARLVARAAARHPKLATQMGNQGHSNPGVRRVVELVEANVVGPIREVHAWTDRPIWPQGIDRPTDTPPVPAQVHWDLFLGPSPERPYHPAYHPFKWRGFWDFGTGALGDMACHVLDPAFWALKLGAPTAVEAEGPAPHPETAPEWSIIRYEYPAREGMPPVKLTWYDGKKLPPADLFHGQKIETNGSLLVGEKGVIYLPDPYGDRYVLLPESKFSGFTPPPARIPNSIGHHAEWVAACKNGTPTGSNFAYATALTGMVLLGNVAYRLGQRIEWDDAAMKVRNNPNADILLRPEVRKGWGI